MVELRLAILLIFLSFPAIACQLFTPADEDVELTRIAGEVLATVTAQAVKDQTAITRPPTRAPGNPYFEPVIFAEDVRDGKAVKPGTEFLSGARQVCVIADFAGMKAGMQTTEIVYRDGMIWFHQVQPWQDNKEKGISSYCLSNEDGTPLDAGDYLYELYVGDELASGGIFTVVP